MSVRAHRIVNIKYGPETFNLWHDQNITDWLQDNCFAGFWDQLNEDGCGMIEIEVTDLEKMLKEVKDINEWTAKAIKRDIEEVKSEGHGYITYSCF